MKYAKEKKYITILDCKRGDIGSTAEAYARSIFTPQKDFESDAMTVNPYLGPESLAPFIKLAHQNNKGIFILVKTSNPESEMVQDQGNPSVSEKIAHWIQSKNPKNEYGAIGAVIGGTIENTTKYRKIMPSTHFLMPGMGPQGGKIENISKCFDKKGNGVLIPVSRGITKPTNIEISQSQYSKEIKTNINHYYSLIKQTINQPTKQ